MFVASKLKPRPSINYPSTSSLRIPDISAASRTRGGRALPPGGLQSEPSTQRQVSPPSLGRISDLRIYSCAVFLVTDGAARRWMKRCTSATTTWWTSCSGVSRRTPRLLLVTLSRPERRAWARSSNDRQQLCLKN